VIIVLRQKLDLLGGTASAEDRISMGKAPEAADDREMVLRVVASLIEACRAEQRHRPQLVGEPLAVHEWHVQKSLVAGRQAVVEPSTDRTLGDSNGLFVGGKRARPAAEHVAWHLVEQQAQGDRTLGTVLPAGQLAGSRTGEHLAIAVADHAIELQRRREPKGSGVLVEPEVEDPPASHPSRPSLAHRSIHRLRKRPGL
jgi:hypothetical protein